MNDVTDWPAQLSPGCLASSSSPSQPASPPPMLNLVPRTLPPAHRPIDPCHATPFARFILLLELWFRGCRGCHEVGQEGYGKDQLDYFPGSLSRKDVRLGSYDQVQDYLHSGYWSSTRESHLSVSVHWRARQDRARLFFVRANGDRARSTARHTRTGIRSVWPKARRKKRSSA